MLTQLIEKRYITVVTIPTTWAHMCHRRLLWHGWRHKLFCQNVLPLIQGKRYLVRLQCRVWQMSALLWAARYGILNTTLYSLDASCGVLNAIDTIHQALPLAVRRKHTAVARILLSQKRVDVDIQHQENQYQKTQYLYQDQYQELHRKTHYQFGAALLAMAAQSGKVEIVNFLLSMKDINPNLGDESGLSPIAYAGCNDQHAEIKVLLDAPTVDPNLKDCTGRKVFTGLLITDQKQLHLYSYYTRMSVLMLLWRVTTNWRKDGPLPWPL